MQQIGWFVALFSGFFVGGIALKTNLLEPFQYSGSLSSVSGVVIEIMETGVTVGGSQHSKRPIVGYRYEFESGGLKYQGISYSDKEAPAVGAAVTVDFKKPDPTVSKIHGMQVSPVAWYAGWIILIFPLVALTMIYFGMKKGRQYCALLSSGILTRGKMAGRNSTSIKINNRPLYEYLFDFAAQNGRKYQAKVRTTDTESMTSEKEKQIFYNPDNPESSVVVSSLPGNPTIDPAGNIAGYRTSLAVLLLPVLTTALYGFIFWKRFGQ